MIYFTSDLHLDHKKIIDYCQRPFRDVDEMNEALIHNWNERVQPGDVVYLLGDFALTTRERIGMFRRRLRGRVVLVRGNHDRGPNAMAACGFDTIYRELELGTGEVLVTLRHKPDPDWIPKFGKHYFFCGHVHEKWRRRGRFINVGVDVWGYRPVTLYEALVCVDEDQ